MPEIRQYSRAIQLRADNMTSERRMSFVASDGTRDSYGTVLPVSEWDLTRYNGNGVVGYQHKVYGYGDEPDPDYVIGKGQARIEDGQLIIDVEFEPEGLNKIADKVWRKLQFGSLNGVSVGFYASGGHWGEGEENYDGSSPTYYYEGLELLEVSVVNIPANPNALRRSIAEEMDDLRDATPPAPQPEPAPEPDDRLTDATSLERERLETIARAALL